MGSHTGLVGKGDGNYGAESQTFGIDFSKTKPETKIPLHSSINIPLEMLWLNF